jgi:hypothetical protein
VLSAKAFKRLRRGARSVNQLNKLHIELDRRMTPAEAFQLPSVGCLMAMPRLISESWLLFIRALDYAVRRMRVVAPDSLIARTISDSKWRALIWRDLRRVELSACSDFHRKKLSESLMLFHRTTSSSALLVAFTPRQAKLVRSTPVFLSAVPHCTDVLFVSPRRSQPTPWQDVDGHRGGFEGFVEDLRTILLAHGYQRSHVVGFSFGAPLAFLTGIAIPSTTTTLIGVLRDIEMLEKDYSEVLKKLSAKSLSLREPGDTKVSFVVGKHKTEDWELMVGLFPKIRGATAVAVETGNHNPLYALHYNGQLPRFLEAMFVGFTTEEEPLSWTTLENKDKLVSGESRYFTN